jgi:hypothetical protein
MWVSSGHFQKRMYSMWGGSHVDCVCGAIVGGFHGLPLAMAMARPFTIGWWIRRFIPMPRTKSPQLSLPNERDRNPARLAADASSVHIEVAPHHDHLIAMRKTPGVHGMPHFVHYWLPEVSISRALDHTITPGPPYRLNTTTTTQLLLLTPLACHSLPCHRPPRHPHAPIPHHQATGSSPDSCQGL